MSELRWSAVGKTAEWSLDQGRVVMVGARRIAVFRTALGFSALKDACPHAGVSLAMGHIHEGSVTCPAHAWAFSLGNGHCTQGPASCSAVTYEVREVDGCLEVGVP